MIQFTLSISHWLVFSDQIVGRQECIQRRAQELKQWYRLCDVVWHLRHQNRSQVVLPSLVTSLAIARVQNCLYVLGVASLCWIGIIMLPHPPTKGIIGISLQKLTLIHKKSQLRIIVECPIHITKWNWTRCRQRIIVDVGYQIKAFHPFHPSISFT